MTILYRDLSFFFSVLSHRPGRGEKALVSRIGFENGL
uniref:Uncharacterized protein n=1 Tax=Rhizophora mucronata TaxID=61149 RepID=A0A2P2MP63_RHIMU